VLVDNVAEIRDSADSHLFILPRNGTHPRVPPPPIVLENPHGR
jgi:hypothetical protein